MRRFHRPSSHVMLVAAVMLGAACASEGTVQPGDILTSDGSASTSAGPVAGVALTPKTLSLKSGAKETLHASASDARGVAVTGKKTTWRSNNTAVAEVTDGGVVTGKAAGSVWVVGTIEQKSDSAYVTISQGESAPVAVTPPVVVPSTISPYFTVLGVVGEGRTEALGGVAIVATRTSESAAATNSVAGTITTDASGHATLKALPNGKYTFTATPPSGSPYAGGTVSIGVSSTQDPHVTFELRKK